MKATIARLENENKALREVNASLTKRVDQLAESLGELGTSVEVLMTEEEIDDAEEEVYNAQVIAQDIAQHIGFGSDSDSNSNSDSQSEYPNFLEETLHNYFFNLLQLQKNANGIYTKDAYTLVSAFINLREASIENRRECKYHTFVSERELMYHRSEAQRGSCQNLLRQGQNDAYSRCKNATTMMCVECSFTIGREIFYVCKTCRETRKGTEKNRDCHSCMSSNRYAATINFKDCRHPVI